MVNRNPTLWEGGEVGEPRWRDVFSVVPFLGESRTMIQFGSPEAQSIVKRDKELDVIRQSIHESLERVHELVEKGRLESVPYEMDYMRFMLKRMQELSRK